MSQLKLYLLGPSRIEQNGQAVEVETRKATALLAYLALHPERLSRDQLAAFLWPEYDQERAYANLRRTLWSLNKAVGDGWIAADNLTLALGQQERVWIDVVEFQQLLAHCRDHGHRSDEVCGNCLAPFGQAVKLVRGDFLEGFSLRDSAPFDDWHFFEAESLRKELAGTLEKLVRGHSSRQEDETAITYARRWLALDPLHEPPHRWLMQLYAWTGQPAVALRQYQECVRVLKAELDAPPDAETTALYKRIRAKQIGPRPAKAPPAPITPLQPQPATSEALPTPARGKEAPPAPAPALEDELRMVTVLCIGLTEALAGAQSYPTERVAQRVKQFLQSAETIVQRYEGRVERVLGEGVVAIFGAQQLHEDDPERAVRAALEVREAAHAKGWTVSAALNSGHVYLSQSGSTLSAIGPVVNFALRLQTKADPGQLLVGEVTYRQTRGVAIYTPLPLALKTNAEPLQVYQIERLQPRPQKVRGIAGLHAPLVGRSKELTTLQEALAAVQNGEGQLITLIGDAGVGKSRLVSELRQEDRKTGRQEDKENDSPQAALFLSPRSAELTSKPLPVSPSSCLWLEGRCLEMSMSASYWPFLDILRAYLAWQPEEAEAGRAGRIVTALDSLVAKGALTAEQRGEMGPLLGNLLAMRFGNDWDERLKFAGPEQIRHQTLIALRDFFVALSRQQPLVLVLEDLHWADSLSLDLITLLMEGLVQQPLLLLCVYRPERQHRAWQLSALAAAKCPDHFSEVRLRELTSRQSQQLVEALLTIENLAPKVKATILQKAQGNPLFVEEVIRSLIDAGIVYRQGEVWRAKAEIKNVVVPETVQSVILSRVDRLGEGLKGILQRAAVIGRVFGRRLLAQLAPPGLDLDNAVLALTNHALIYQERVVPEEEYSFKHVLVQEAIYQTTLAERREQFHRQVGEAMEQIYADNLTERYEQLAYHYDRSGVVEKAIEYLLKAGEKARRAYLNAEAIGDFQRAMKRLDAPSSVAVATVDKAQQGWRLQALKGLGQVYLGIGNVAEAEAHLHQAIVQGRQMQLPAPALVQIYFQLGEVLWWQGRYRERIRIGEEALTLLGDDRESVEAAMINSVLDWGYCMTGEFVRALTFTFRNVQFVAALPYVEELRPAYIHICLAYVQFQKNVEEARHWVQRLQKQATQHHDLRALINVHQDISAFIQENCGDLRGAVAQLQQSLQLCAKIGDAKHESDCLLILGRLYRQLGELTQAEEFTRRALATIERAHVIPWIINWYWQLGGIDLCQGAPATAIEHLQNALHEARAVKDQREESWGFYSLARVHLAQGKQQEAWHLLEVVAARLSLPEMTPYWVVDKQNYVVILSALETACTNSATFHTHCQRLRTEEADAIGSSFQHWYLEAGQADGRLAALDFSLNVHESQKLKSPDRLAETNVMEPGKIENSEWSWHDPSQDCSFTLDDGLVIHAANGRNLWQVNRSAPRLLHPVTGDFALQVNWSPLSTAQPAIGGLLLWKDEQNYLRLDKGLFGVEEISFQGSLANQDLIIGRGRLPVTRAFLRLERIGERVNALCSADGEEWFTVGHVDFPVADPLQVGMHAIGMIDRLIYPGAYPDGTAIRFESFAIYRPLTA